MVEDKIQVAVEIQPALEDHTGVGWYLYELLNNIDRSEIEIIGNYFNFLNRHDYRKSLSNLDLKYNKLQYVPYRIYKILTEKYNVSYNLFFSIAASSICAGDMSLLSRFISLNGISAACSRMALPLSVSATSTLR